MVEVPSLTTMSWPDLEHCEGFDGPCENTDAAWTWMTTQYQDARSNYRYLCAECAEYGLEYWSERWREYYADQGFYMSKPLPTEHVDELLGSNMD